MPSSNNYYAEGDLTIRGITLPATINFQLEELRQNYVLAKGYVTVNRLDFKVGQGEWKDSSTIKNEVRVDFRIVAQKQ